MRKGFSIFVLVLFLTSSVSALGIASVKTNVDFVPGLEKTVTFTIVNSEGEDISIAVSAQGELEKYIFIDEPTFRMTAGEGSRQFSYKLKLPERLSPGLHTTEVVVLQLPEEGAQGETFVGATVAVATQLHVRVPFPGKYAEATMHVIGPGEDGKIAFLIPVISRGEFDLVKVRATIDIFTSLNEEIASVESGEVSIPSGQRRELVAEWDAAGVNPGPYFAIATLTYDEETLTIEKEFNIGRKRLVLESIGVRDFKLGEIAKFNLLISNEFNQDIKGAFATMFIYNEDGTVLADLKTPTEDIPANEKAQMIMFWDTAGVREKVYDAEFFLNYEDTVDQLEFTVDVRKDEIIIATLGYVISRGGGEGSTIKVLIGIIIFLIIANLSWFIFLRKKFKKK